MGPKKDNDSSKVKRKNTNIMIDIKKEIIAKHENGVHVSDLATYLIREISVKWGEVQSFVERYHHDKAVASRSINIFNDNAMCHFINILKRRQKQITMDNFLVRQEAQ
ncbi:hypothetical protein L798_09812 [Zootermopsis nevadensis]|uniref:Uncharacterized protein n=1 Tax=Zootermopsis nevadensis TaxID=136037 RepID=A0A067QZL4_ZOONE|nr:hypothetical protein L798_09812 [Zootermopsis nevadensis]